MWEQMARAAADDSGAGERALQALDSVQIVYCQTWQYDDPTARLCERLDVSPKHTFYSGIGGTTPQVLVNSVATSMLEGEIDCALVTGAEALATQRAFKKRGDKYRASYPPEQRGAYPWEWPPDPIEIAHEAMQAWLNFSVFDNARRAHLGVGLDDYRQAIGKMMAPMTQVAAASPHAWYPIARSASEIVDAKPENRMVGYPYTKYMISVMDIDMASALLLMTHAKADELGVPADQRVYLRGWCYANDPILVAAHDDMSVSPAMKAASGEAMRGAGVGADDLKYLDLYSCFPSSVNFACDALGIPADGTRSLTLTGGLPYHGGPASNYLGHSIGAAVEALRADPGTCAMVSGVGMFMTKHVFGVYSTEPGPVAPPDPDIQARLDAEHPPVTVLPEHDGKATVAAYSVVHGREGGPEWGLLVCDVEGGARTYGKLTEVDALLDAEERELVGTTVHLAPTDVDLITGGAGRMNLATI